MNRGRSLYDIKPMRKPRRHPELLRLVGAQLDSHPFAIGSRALSNVDRNVDDSPTHHAHELALRIDPLKVEASKDASRRHGDVVLNKGSDSDSGPHLGIEVADETPSRIVEVLKVNEEDVRNLGGMCLHGITAYLAL